MLEEVDVIDGHTCFLEDMLGCGDGCFHDVLGLNTALTVCLDGCKRLESVFLCPFPGCDNEGRCSIAELGRVTCSDDSILLEDGLEFSEGLHGGILPDTLIVIEGYVSLLGRDGDGKDLLLELASLVCGGCLEMRIDGKLVRILPGHVEPLCDDLSGESHVLVVEDVPESIVDHGIDHSLVIHLVSPPSSLEKVRCCGHVLHSSDCEDVVLSGFDGICCKHGCLHSGSTNSIDSERTDLNGKTCTDCSLPCRVLSETCTDDVTHDALFDICGLETCPLDGFLDNHCTEFGCLESGKGLSVFSNRGPD